MPDIENVIIYVIKVEYIYFTDMCKINLQIIDFVLLFR